MDSCVKYFFFNQLTGFAAVNLFQQVKWVGVYDSLTPPPPKRRRRRRRRRSRRRRRRRRNRSLCPSSGRFLCLSPLFRVAVGALSAEARSAKAWASRCRTLTAPRQCRSARRWWTTSTSSGDPRRPLENPPGRLWGGGLEHQPRLLPTFFGHVFLGGGGGGRFPCSIFFFEGV